MSTVKKTSEILKGFNEQGCKAALTVYKQMCENQMLLLEKIGFNTEKDTLDHNDMKLVTFVQGNLGYFIGQENLFSSWITLGVDFNVGHTIDAMRALDRLTLYSHKDLIQSVFTPFEHHSQHLGNTSHARTTALRFIIWDIEEGR